MESWRRYLAAAIGAVAGRPYALGQHDCVSFAAGSLGRHRGAARRAARRAYATRAEGAALLGWPNPNFARAGDVVTVDRLAAEVAVVALDGASLLFIPEGRPGPFRLPMKLAQTAWKAGA